MDEPAAAFGPLLRRRRLAAGLSQEELAERAGLSVDAVSVLERGRRASPRPATVRLLADALGLEPGPRAELVAAARPDIRPPPADPAGALPLVADPAGALPLPAAPPLPPTRLVGREREVAEICARLRGEGPRLLTLTGPGGVGKTRLAIAAAEELAGRRAHGVCWVDLAPLADPALAPATVAQALGIRESGDQPLIERLRAVLLPREMLLLLDNCEHLVAAVADLVGDLLAACPRLTVLATSRERLRLRGEHEFAVRPLAAPATGVGPESPVAGLAGVAAVRLFVERAAEVGPGFALRAGNAADVAAICARLDGLPLALELAAAWSKVLPPDALLARLERRLPLLTGGPRDLPTRLQTMHDAIAWSYDLLSSAEQAAFRRLSVFAGGCTLQAAASVAGDGSRLVGTNPAKAFPDPRPPTPDPLNLLASLVDKSLLRRVDEPASSPAPPRPWTRPAPWEPEPRYTMLETIREFGLERLAAEGEEAAVRRAHAAFFTALVDQAAPALNAGEAAWFWRLGADRDNLRAALTWLFANAAEVALRVAGVLMDFWVMRGEFAEGRGWLERALVRAPDASPSLRVAALIGIGQIAQYQGDYATARAVAEEAVTLARAQEDRLGMLSAEFGLSQVNRSQGRGAEAVASAATALRLAREHGDAAWIGWCLQRLGIETHAEGDLVRAEALFAEGLVLFRSLRGEWGESHTLHGLAAVARDLGEIDRAAALFGECLAICTAIDELSGLVDALVGLADVAEASNQPEAAARLLGAVKTLRDELGYVPFGDVAVLADRTRADLRARLGEARFAQAWDQGTRLTPAEAVAEAQAVVDGVLGSAESDGATPAASTPRHDTGARSSRR